MPDQDALNERELEILNRIAQGMTNHEIAQELVISVNTVRWYNKQIYSKLGVHSRTLAIAHARDRGLLDPQDDTPLPTATPRRDNLPAQLTPFIGRQHDLIELAALLADPAQRLITVVGPGGIGKTRLALEVAQAHLDQYEHGVFMIDLTPPGMPETILSTAEDFAVMAIASHIGFSFLPGAQPRQQLTNYLRSRQMLLVLDNFDHLVSAANILTDLLSAAPAVTILVTSREILNIYGETVYPVNALPLPPKADETALDYDAIQLFSQSAQRSRADFALQPGDLPLVIQICERVGALPLGIELAAAWVRSLSLAAIVDELNQGLDFLESRSYSIRRAFDQSWNRLTENERTTFVRMSVFQGGCTREAARAITGASLRVLTSLVDKSLLRHTPGDRYAMHQLLRQYAAEKVTDLAAEPDAHAEYGRYYAALAEQWGRALHTGSQPQAIEIIEQELENMQAAWHWAISHHEPTHLRQFAEIWYFFEIRNRWHEARELYSASIAALDDDHPLPLGKLHAALSHFVWRLGDWDEAEQLCQRSLDLLATAGAEAESVLPRLVLGNLITMRGDLDAGEQHYQQTYAIAEKHGDRWGMATLLGNMSIIAEQRGHYDLARQRLQSQLAITAAINDDMGTAIAYSNLGQVAQRTQRYAEALEHYQQSHNLALGLNQKFIVATTLNHMGDVARLQGQYDRAGQFIERALTMNRESGDLFHVIYSLNSLGELALLQQHQDRAWACFREALSIATYIESAHTALQTLTQTARLLMFEGQLEKALHILTVVLDHPAHRAEDLNLVTQLHDELHDELPGEIFNAAVERGHDLDWRSVVDDLLAMPNSGTNS